MHILLRRVCSSHSRLLRACSIHLRQRLPRAYRLRAFTSHLRRRLPQARLLRVCLSLTRLRACPIRTRWRRSRPHPLSPPAMSIQLCGGARTTVSGTRTLAKPLTRTPARLPAKTTSVALVTRGTTFINKGTRGCAASGWTEARMATRLLDTTADGIAPPGEGFLLLYHLHRETTPFWRQVTGSLMMLRHSSGFQTKGRQHLLRQKIWRCSTLVMRGKGHRTPGNVVVNGDTGVCQAVKIRLKCIGAPR